MGSPAMKGERAIDPASSVVALGRWSRRMKLLLAALAGQTLTIAPGVIEVERYHTPGYDREALGRRVPAGRVGFPGGRDLL